MCPPICERKRDADLSQGGILLKMETFSELSQIPPGACLAIGIFDGVHLGHQAVLSAAGEDGPRGVLTFDPHPAVVVGGRKLPGRFLTTLEHKKALLAEMGVDFVVVLEFNRYRAAQDAEEFAEELFSSELKRVAVGEDWRFGAGRKGDITLLGAAGQHRGVEVVGVPAKLSEGERIKQYPNPGGLGGV